MIEPAIINQLIRVVQNYQKINKIYLFGSRANGDFHDKSDIDLVFEAPDMSNEEWASFTFTLEEELDTLLQIDMIKFEDANKQLKEEINQTAKVLYCSE
jgi:uncharacterized protein